MPIGSDFNINATESEGSGRKWWNMNHPEKEDYSLELKGWVTEIHEVLSTFKGEVKWFQPNEKTGLQEPRRDWMLVIQTDNGDEVCFSEEKHKQIWQQLWLSAVMLGEPEPANEKLKKRKLPDLLAGAHVVIRTKPKEQWTGPARPWAAMIDQLPPAENPFCGFFEDWLTDTRWTESPQHEAWVARVTPARDELDATIKRLDETNPKLAAIARKAVYSDTDIPF